MIHLMLFELSFQKENCEKRPKQCGYQEKGLMDSKEDLISSKELNMPQRLLIQEGYES